MNDLIWQNASTIFGGAFVAILALIYIASRAMVSWKKAITEVKVADAEGEIYKKLSDRNEKLETMVGKVYDENKGLIIRLGQLERVAEDLKETKDINLRLREKLDQKDGQFEALLKAHTEEREIFYQVLNRKDDELARQSKEIMRLTGEVNELKVRLATDERIFTICPMRVEQVEVGEVDQAASTLLPGGGHDGEVSSNQLTLEV